MPQLSFEKFKAGESESPVAVVFVHGFSGDLRRTWGKIPEILSESGRLTGWDLFFFGYPSHKWSVDLLGLWSADPALEQLSIELCTVLERTKGKLAFVAHSMGGLVVQRALVMNPELRNRTTHVTLLGTPSAGLEKARPVSWLKQQARDMAKGGPFVTALRAQWTALNFDVIRPFRFFAVAGNRDQFVGPDTALKPFPLTMQRVIAGDHLSMLDAESVDAPCVQVILENLTTDSVGAGLRSAAQVAVDAGEFQEAIVRLWPGRAAMDDIGTAQLAIALERTGRREEAIALLREHKPEGTDVLGVLGGCLKRQWLITRSAEDYKTALDLYRRGFETSAAKNQHDQALYHGINVAYLLLAGSSPDVAGAKEMAQKTLEHCAGASKQSIWRPATEADALMILGRIEEGFVKHREAAGQAEMKAWQARSIEEQALRIAELCEVSREDGGKLAAIYEGG